MQAVILAGGLGTRLGAITQTIPKPMVPVAGVPYLEHQLRELERQRIGDIVLLVGYLGDRVEAYFGDGSRFGLSIRYSYEPAPLGTGGALALARPLLAADFLLIYGDSYLPIPYAEALERLRSSGAEGAMAVYDNGREDTSVKNNVALDREGYVTRYSKDGGGGLNYVEAGVLAFRAGVAARIAPGRAVSLEEEIFPELIAARRLAAYVTAQRFYDIGTPERLAVLERLLRK